MLLSVFRRRNKPGWKCQEMLEDDVFKYWYPWHASQDSTSRISHYFQKTLRGESRRQACMNCMSVCKCCIAVCQAIFKRCMAFCVSCMCRRCLCAGPAVCRVFARTWAEGQRALRPQLARPPFFMLMGGASSTVQLTLFGRMIDSLVIKPISGLGMTVA